MDAFFNNMGEKLKEALPVLGIKLEEEEGKREKFAPFERPRSVLKSRGGSKSPVASHSSTPTRVQFVGLDEELVACPLPLRVRPATSGADIGCDATRSKGERKSCQGRCAWRGAGTVLEANKE
eukprot:3118575-Rhodomonas_salina.2